MLLLAGCSDDDSPTGPAASQLVGTWQAVSVTVDGQATSLSDGMDWADGAVRSVLVLGPSLSLINTEYDASGNILYQSSGTYSTSGSTLTLNFTLEDGVPTQETLVATYSITNNQLTTTLMNEGSSLVIIWSAQ